MDEIKSMEEQMLAEVAEARAEVRGKLWLIYRHAVSTVVLD